MEFLKKTVNTFTGLNQDDILEAVTSEWHLDAWHLRVYAGKDGKGMAARKMGGTLEVPWDAPDTGDNTGLGAYWDEKGDTLLVFIHNTDGLHSLIWHHPGEPQARTIRIPAMNLTLGNPVTGCALVNGELLLFTDGATYPKMLNLSRADAYLKKSVVRLYLPQASVTGPGFTRSFEGRVVLNGVPQGLYIPLPPAATAQQVRDFRPMVGLFADNWNNQPTLASSFTAQGCADYIELTAVTSTDLLSVDVRVTDTINGVVQAPFNCIAEYANRYNGSVTVTQWQCRMSRFKPITPPTVTPGTDTARKSNLTKEKLFQFAYGFGLRDEEETFISPISDIPATTASPCGGGANPNFITVGFDQDKWLLDPETRGEIDTINLYVRNGNNGSWFLVKSLEKYEWIYSKSFRFYNDGRYAPADQAFVEASMNAIPPVANALEMFTDSDDNQRVVLGGIEEGDDNPCVEVSATVEFSAAAIAPETVDLVGRVVIQGVFDPNPAVFGTQHYNFNQPIWVFDSGVGPVWGGFGPSAGPFIELLTNNPQLWDQTIPMGGFTIYAAGTDKYDITTQTNFPATVSNGTVSATLWAAPANHPAANRNVYDGSSRGYSATPTNRTHRDAIRSMIEDDHIYSTFRIEGLERGKTYIIRMASTKVDLLDDGTTYDLNNPSLAWQGTSTRTAQMGSNDALVNPSGGFYPAGTVIKSGRTECLVTIPLTGPTVIDIGNCVVYDTTNPNPIDGSFLIHGYCFDNLSTDYSASDDVRTKGASAERQLIRLLNHGAGPNYDPFSNPSFNILYLAPFLWPVLAPTIIYNTFIQQLFGLGTGHPGDYRTYTDHNGYWWFFNKNQPGHNPQAQWCGVAGDPGNPSGIVTATNNPNGTQFYQILNDFNDSKWEGDLEGALAPVSGNLFNGPGAQQYIFANLLPTLTHRTHIKAKVVEALSGNPIQGVTAVFSNGRVGTSGQDGIINLVAFGDTEENLNRRFNDVLVLVNNKPCRIDFLGGNPYAVNINAFTPGGDYSESPESNWYDVRFIVPIQATVTAIRARCLSRGGTYPFGYFVGRGNGDGTAVKWVGDIRIPNIGENLVDYDPITYPATTYPNGHYLVGPASIRWTITGDVPSAWIGDYEFIQFVIGGDGTRSFQLQWVAGQVVYSSAWKESTSSPTPTSYASGNATEIYIVLTDSLVRYKDLNTNSQLGYLWEEGDLIRILTDRFGNPAQQVYEAVVTGQRGKWITLKYDNTLPQLFGGEVIEIFTPAKSEDDDDGQVYYAVPEGLVLINDPYGPTPTWNATTGLISNGDTWLLPTSVPFRASDASPWQPRIVTRESKSASDFFESESWGRGKVAFVDHDARRQKRGVLMRYTEAFKPGTSINGLNIADGLNFRIVENWFVEIMALKRVEGVIVGICKTGGFSIYVGVQQLQSTEESITEIVSKVLGNVRPFAHRHGTLDRLSVVRSETSLFWLDRNNGVAVYYNSNQLQDIGRQNKMRSYFTTKSITFPVEGNAMGGWDMVNGDIIFSFPAHTHDDGTNVQEIDAESIHYHDQANKFVARMEFAPDCWGTTRQRLWSFVDGRLLLHDAPGAPLNLINGVQLDLTIDVPVVANPMEAKNLQTIWLARGEGWDIPLITNNMGQTTFVVAGDITTREAGVSKVNGIHGKDRRVGREDEPLLATAYIVRLRHAGPGECHLLWMESGYTSSDDTVR